MILRLWPENVILQICRKNIFLLSDFDFQFFLNLGDSKFLSLLDTYVQMVLAIKFWLKLGFFPFGLQPWKAEIDEALSIIMCM